jgi:hypothetical protein
LNVGSTIAKKSEEQEQREKAVFAILIPYHRPKGMER